MIYVYHSHTLILIHHFEFPFSATRFRSFVSNFIYRHIKQSIPRRAATTKATATRQTGQQFAIVACFDKCYEYAVAVVLVDALLFSVHSPYGSLCHELSMWQSSSAGWSCPLWTKRVAAADADPAAAAVAPCWCCWLVGVDCAASWRALYSCCCRGCSAPCWQSPAPHIPGVCCTRRLAPCRPGVFRCRTIAGSRRRHPPRPEKLKYINNAASYCTVKLKCFDILIMLIRSL